MAEDLAAQLEKLSLKPEPFILQPKFWEDEGGGDVPGNCAPLLNRNNACLATDAAANKATLDRTAKWPGLCGADKVTSLPPVKPVKGAGTSESILWRDAERTFKTEPYREQMIKVLELVADGDYHQGMGYLTGFLLLVVPPGDVSKMLHRIGTDEKYTPGYWKGQPEAFVRDAMVYMELVKTRLPAVAEHLEKASLVPESYAQKWFVGLCVHTMPFASLVQVFESFLSEGYIFLFKLSLAIVEAVADKILATNTAEVNKLFELLRLDAKLFPDTETGHKASQKLDPNCSAGTSSNTDTNVERPTTNTDASTRTSTATDTDTDNRSHATVFFESIVSKARAMELSQSEVQKMRETAWESLQDKLEKVRAREQELKDEDSDEITFSDEDSDEEDEAARLARLAAQ